MGRLRGILQRNVGGLALAFGDTARLPRSELVGHGRGNGRRDRDGGGTRNTTINAPGITNPAALAPQIDRVQAWDGGRARGWRS